MTRERRRGTRASAGGSGWKKNSKKRTQTANGSIFARRSGDDARARWASGARTNLEILGRVTRELENLGGEVFCGRRRRSARQSPRGDAGKKYNDAVLEKGMPDDFSVRATARSGPFDRRTEDGGGVNRGGGADAAAGGGAVLSVTGKRGNVSAGTSKIDCWHSGSNLIIRAVADAPD